jgi:hypothetical protein
MKNISDVRKEDICFVHDKSANAEYLKNDVELWKKI